MSATASSNRPASTLGMDGSSTADAEASVHSTERFAADFREAVLACREGNWRRGYEILTRLAPETGPKATLPGVFYSYLGVAVARCEGNKHDGMELARYGLRLQPREADNYSNLALLCLTLGRRHEALRWLDKGLRYEPQNRRLNELRETLGLRRRPPIPFLARSSPLNVILGQVVHRFHEGVQRRETLKQEEIDMERAEARALAQVQARARPPGP